jgi:hypothetical protein
VESLLAGKDVPPLRGVQSLALALPGTQWKGDKHMEKYPEIMEGMKHCKQNSSTSCEGCPYRGKTVSERSCRQQLLVDAAEALAAEELRADKATDEVEHIRLTAKEAYTRRDALEAECCDLREETEMLAAENRKLREELKNRPEVGFDGDTFDASLDAIKGAACEASYWQGQADALKWALREVTIAANEEGGDDV